MIFSPVTKISNREPKWAAFGFLCVGLLSSDSSLSVIDGMSGKQVGVVSGMGTGFILCCLFW